MASLVALLCTVLLISLAASFPINSDVDTTSTSSSNSVDRTNYALAEGTNSVNSSDHSQTEEETDSVDSSDSSDTEEKETDEKDSSKMTSSTEATTPSNEHETTDNNIPEYCSKEVIFNITHKVHTFVNGERTSYNKTITIRTRDCCEGYELIGGLCRRDLCIGKTCSDPDSKCVTVRRCGQLLPVFIISSTGIISTTCTQPTVTQEHLNQCSNVTKECSAHSQCGQKESDDPMVCFNTKCDACEPGPEWLKLSGDSYC